MSSSSAVGFSSGGIDVSSIVSGLMQVERQPVNRLMTRQAEAKARSDAFGRLKTQLDTLRTSARDVTVKGVGRLSSSVSNPSAASVSLGASAAVGSTSFTVAQLASTHSLRTTNAVSAPTSTVVSGSRFAVSTTSGRLGFTSISASDAVSTGSYVLEVTQATSAATKTGSALGAATAISSSNNTLDLSVNGVATSVTLASGSYTPAELATEVQSKLGSSVAVSVTSSGQLRISTVAEGSSTSLQITGGTAIASLGLTTDGSALLGTDGKVRVGGGAEVTISGTGSGTSIGLSAGGGTLTIADTGPLRVGTSTVNVVDTGDRSLQSLATAVNAANAGVLAAAVKQSEGNWYLQLTSASSGTASKVVAGGTDWSTLTAAQDAQLVVGSGPGAITVVSSTNTFTDVMPGVTITATAVSPTPVTVNVRRDETATADAVQAFLDTANALLNEIKTQTKFDPVSRRGGPLSGDPTVRSLASQVRSVVTETISSLAYTNVSAIGITTQRDGTFALDRTKLVDALRTNPAAVDRLFQRGGSSAGVDTSYAGADDNTLAGSYAVAVTTAARRATTGVVVPTGGATLGVRMGSTTVSVSVATGASAAETVAALNAAISAAGLGLSASTSGTGLTIVSSVYGAAGNFELNTDVNGGGSWTAYAGADVVGTIDGVAATGVGRRLTVPSDSSSSAKGLQVDVAEGATGTLSSVTYSPGAAARLGRLINQLTAANGSVTTTAGTYDRRLSDFTTQISKFEEKLVTREEQLRKQWAKVQTTLSGLESQQSWLTNQIKGLNRDS
jgi:flagellar hook-associated protein 2